MKLTYGQIETTLANHLHIHPDKVSTLRSRIKQLQRLEFPPGVNVGRGAKMEYTSEHLFQLVTAFEFISFGFPAQTACNIVRDYWDHFAAGFALAALQERRVTSPMPEQVLAILWLQSLHEIQFAVTTYNDGQASPSSIKICDESAAMRELRPYHFNNNYTRLVVSLGALLKRVIQIARERAGVAKASVFDPDFHGWLPRDDMPCVDFKSYYPDRSNLKKRRTLHMIYGNDPEVETPAGIDEANEFLANDYSSEPPF